MRVTFGGRQGVSKRSFHTHVQKSNTITLACHFLKLRSRSNRFHHMRSRIKYNHVDVLGGKESIVCARQTQRPTTATLEICQMGGFKQGKE
jgi:hypothetical protein